VAVRRLDGIDSVEVSLERGLARIVLRPESGVGLYRIRRLILDNGFTPKSADVRVSGRLREREGRRVLEVPGSAEVYWLAPHPDTPAELDRIQGLPLDSRVQLKGRVGETTTAGDRLELQVLRLGAGR
jgi:hypothetical protein